MAAVLLAGVLLAPVPSAHALPEQVQPGEPETSEPTEKLLKNDEADQVNNRKQLLGDLYDRLSKSADPEDAKVLASAIENLWLRSGSDTVDLLMTRAAKLMEEENFDVALTLLDSIVEIAPDYSEGWTRRAAVHFVKKDFGRSLDDLRHALALDPHHYKAIQGLGLLMQEFGDKKSALRAFRKLLQVYPHLDEARQAEQELSREVEGQGI